MGGWDLEGSIGSLTLCYNLLTNYGTSFFSSRLCMKLMIPLSVFFFHIPTFL